jgi:uncharacterized protein YyaL (SSP411 family)
MLRDCYRYFLPERRLVLKNPKAAAALEKVAPGVKDYPPSDEGPAAYICLNFACLPPITDPQDLLVKLGQLAARQTLFFHGQAAAQEKAE